MSESKYSEDKFHQTTLWDAIHRMNLQYEFHPIANIFPLMSDEELASLEDNMQKNGFLKQYPILLFEGKILDGRNRYYISEKLDITPSFNTFQGNEAEALEFVWSSNYDRRHLSSVQKVLSTQEYHKMVSKLAKKRKFSTLKQYHGDTNSSLDEDSESSTVEGMINDRNPQTRDIIARKVRVSPHTVDTINKALELEDEHPEIKEKLDKARNGDKSITVKEVKKEINKIETQKRKEEKLKELRKNKLKHQEDEFKPIIVHQDALEFLNSIEDCSQDLLVTDPPYMKELEMDITLFVAQWIPRALEKVKDSGRVYIFTGNYPEEIRAYIDIFLSQDRFELANILIWTYKNNLGPSTNKIYKNNYQCIFYLYGKDAPPLNTDSLLEKLTVKEISAPDGRQYNRFHKWQKPDDLAELIIRHATQEGDLVIDPFAGSGTFILKATEMKRYAKGSEISPEAIEIAEKRGCIIQ